MVQRVNILRSPPWTFPTYTCVRMCRHIHTHIPPYMHCTHHPHHTVHTHHTRSTQYTHRPASPCKHTYHTHPPQASGVCQASLLGSTLFKLCDWGRSPNRCFPRFTALKTETLLLPASRDCMRSRCDDTVPELRTAAGTQLSFPLILILTT